jgi:predicted acyl esterase
MDGLMTHPENRLWLSWGGHFATTDVSDEIGPREDALLGWMQHWLTGAGDDEPDLPRVTWWSMNEQRNGLNRHGSSQWPPPQMRYRDLELTPGQAVNAGTQPGDDPIGNWGANQAGLGEVYRNLPSGTPADTLITATEPLDKPAIYAGAAQADLRWTSTAANSQANVKVWDVAPDGTGTLLARGCAMAPGDPGAQRRVQFELWPSAVEIPAGHHLEVWAQPADVPAFRPAPDQAVVTLDAKSVVRLPLIGAADVRPAADATDGDDDPSSPSSGRLGEDDATGRTLPATGGQAAGAVWTLMAGAAAVVARRRR